MQIKITTPALVPVIQVTMELKPEMAIALLFGYIVLGIAIPSEIGKAVDEIEEKDVPAGWKTVVAMWQGRGDDVEVCKVISPWLKEALS